MKGIQEKYGKDKFAVLLLSVDASYGQPVADATREDRATMAQHNITWQNVVEPEGWDGIQKRFNIDGYGLTLIGPDGKVLGKDLFPPDIERLLDELYGK